SRRQMHLAAEAIAAVTITAPLVAGLGIGRRTAIVTCRRTRRGSRRAGRLGGSRHFRSSLGRRRGFGGGFSRYTFSLDTLALGFFSDLLLRNAFVAQAILLGQHALF